MDCIRKFILIGKTYLATPIVSHFAILYHHSDPIQLIEHKQNPESRFHYYFPLVIISLIALYGTVGLQLESGNQVTLPVMYNSPYIFTHQVVPREIWSPATFIILLNTLGSIGVFMVFAFNGRIKSEYVIYDRGDGKLIMKSKELNKIESGAIVHFRKKAKWMHISGFVFYLWVALFYLANVFINSAYTTSVSSILFWMAGFPLYLFYVIYALFDSVIFIILISRFTRIRQNVLYANLKDLNRKFESNMNLRFKWYTYLRLNQSMIQVCKQLDEYSRLCVPFLSVIFPYYITIQCYVLCVVFFTGAPVLHKQFLFSGLVNCNIFLFVITHECAQVARKNRQFEVQNRIFYLNFRKELINSNLRVSNAALLKAESLQINRRLHSYAFRLVGNYRITSKTFYMIISYIGTYFVFVFKTL